MAEPGPVSALRDAIEAAASGNLEQAIGLLEEEARRIEADQREPEPQVIALLGALHLNAGNPKRAMELLEPLTQSEPADPAVLYNASRAAFALDDPARGEDLLSRSAALSPVSPAGRDLGLLRLHQGRRFESYRLLRPWVIIQPDDLEARRAAAWLALELERPEEAESFLSDLPQDQTPVRMMWGRLLLLQGNPGGALATLSPLVQRKGSLPAALGRDLQILLARSQLETDRAPEALATLSGLEIGSSSDALLYARALMATEGSEEASRILEPRVAEIEELSLEELTPSERQEAASVVRAYGTALLGSERHSEAAAALEIAIRLVPWDSSAWRLASRIASSAGKPDGASRFAETAERLDAAQRSESLLYQIDASDATGRRLDEARKWLAEGEYDAALHLVRRERELSQNDLRCQFMETQILIRAQRLDDAEKVARETLSLAPQNADAVYQLGLILMARGSPEEAETNLRRALDLAPDHIAAMNDLAVLLLSQQRLEEGRELLERVLLLSPGDETARRNLASLDQRP